MSNPIKHHYVPQWHLRQWISEDNKLQSYFRLENGILSSRRYSTKSLAFETNLYTWASPNRPEEQQLEKEFFQKLDSNAAEVANKLRQNTKIELSHKYRDHWAQYLTACLIRLPKELSNIKKISKESDLDKLEELSIGKNSNYDKNNWQDFIRTHFPGFFEDRGLEFIVDYIQNGELNDFWLSLPWRVMQIKGSEYQLLTSDKPFITRGISQIEKGILALYPLSPYYIFYATNYTFFDLLLSSKPDFITLWSNNLQIKEARRFLIAKDESLTWHIEKYFGDSFPDPPLPE